jgi:hypothetical protein
MEGYVPVYVPERHHREMLAHLISLMPEPSAAPPTTEPQSTTQPDDPWSKDDVLWKVFLDVTDDMRTLFVALANHPGKRLSVSDLADAVGSPERVRGALSSLTKRMRSYKLKEWPFAYRKDGRTGLYTYEIDENRAEAILGLEQRLEAIVQDATNREPL